MPELDDPSIVVERAAAPQNNATFIPPEAPGRSRPATSPIPNTMPLPAAMMQPASPHQLAASAARTMFVDNSPPQPVASPASAVKTMFVENAVSPQAQWQPRAEPRVTPAPPFGHNDLSARPTMVPGWSMGSPQAPAQVPVGTPQGTPAAPAPLSGAQIQSPEYLQAMAAYNAGQAQAPGPQAMAPQPERSRGVVDLPPPPPSSSLGTILILLLCAGAAVGGYFLVHYFANR
jgi:hypothetical protein